MWNETLEKKCRYYQDLADYKLMPNSYIIFHIDGRSFSKFCKRFKKPYDDNFILMMNETAKFLCENIPNIKLGYVQSDEITLIYSDKNEDDTSKDMWFRNRICKMCSIGASLATGKFMSMLYESFESVPIIQFDCKVWNVPSTENVFEWLLYRQRDCVRNSKQMLSQTYFPQKTLNGKNTDDAIEMVKNEKGINWYSFDDGKKYGRFMFKKHTVINTEHGDVERMKWNLCEGKKLSDKDFKETINNFLTCQ